LTDSPGKADRLQCVKSGLIWAGLWRPRLWQGATQDIGVAGASLADVNQESTFGRPVELLRLSVRDTKFAFRDISGDKARPRFIRSAVLIAYAEAAKTLGLDPYRMLRKVGLPVSTLENPDIRIRVDDFQALLNESASAGACEELGLLVGREVRLSMKGALGLLIREQPSVRAAIEALKRYLRYQNENVEIRTEEQGGLVVFTPMLLSARTRRDRRMVELTVAMYVQIFRALLGEAWMPVRVTFTHDPPKDPAPYRLTLGEVAYNQPADTIVLTLADLDTPLPNADPETAREIARHIERTATPRTESIGEVVLDLIVRLLPGGRASVDEVARHLGVDRRTVHRRLAGEGRSFTQLLETARCAVATEELSHGDQPLGVVTGLVGFSSLSTFSRWFHQTYGIQPSEFRRQAHHSA